MNKIDWKNIRASTIVRTIITVITVINQCIASIGATSFADSRWYQILSLIATIITTVVMAWYNNDYTQYAVLTGRIFKALDEQKVSKEDLERYIIHIENIESEEN